MCVFVTDVVTLICVTWADVLQGCVAEVVGQIASNRGIAHLFDYCFTTNGTIYSMKSVFNIQEMVQPKNVFFIICA